MHHSQMERSVGSQPMSVFARQMNNSTDSPITFESWIATYWYILLIVLVVLVVVCVLLCACILRRHPREVQSDSSSRNKNTDATIDLDQVQGAARPAHRCSLPTTTTSCSLSADSTPIPSPHSSQHSIRTGSGLSRGRRTSPRLSSGSSETLRPDVRSISSVGSSSSLMTHQTKIQDGSQQGPVEKKTSRRSRSGPIVRVSSLPSVKSNRSGLHPAHSTMSVESSSSGRSGVAYCFYPTSDLDTLVEVGVTVHTPGDPDKSVRIATAAALAESAHKLAQEAASFIDEEQPAFSHAQSTHYRGTSLRGSGRNPVPSMSGRSSSFSLNHHYNPTPYHHGYTHRAAMGFGGHRSVSSLGRNDVLPMLASRRTDLSAQFSDSDYPSYFYPSAQGDSRFNREPVSQLHRHYSLGSRLRDQQMSRTSAASSPGGKTVRMLAMSGDSSKSNLHHYTTNSRSTLSSAAVRPIVIERDSLPLHNDRFSFSKREVQNEHKISATPSNISVEGMSKVSSVTEVEQLDGRLDVSSPIPPSPSTSTGLSSQTEVNSQVEDVTQNPSQTKEASEAPAQAASSGPRGNHIDLVSPGRRRFNKHGSPIPEIIQSPVRHYKRSTQSQAGRDSHAFLHQEDEPTYRRGSFDSRTGQQGYVRTPVQHHISGTSKKATTVSLRDRDHPTPTASDYDCDMNYYNGRDVVNDSSRQYLPVTISSVNVTVDV